MSSAAPGKAPFDLKSTAWTLTALRLHTTDTPVLARALEARFRDTPELFDGDPLVIDLTPVRDLDSVPDFASLLMHLHTHKLMPVAVQGGNPEQTAAARAAGLVEALDAASGPAAAGLPVASTVVEVHEVVREVVREVEVVKEAPPAAGVPTLVVDKPLRSGQRVYARGGDLVVLAQVSFGAEVIADGHVHVYGALRGRAIAGARGDTRARIFATQLDPQLMAIAGIYRTAEVPLPDNVAGKPAMVRLDGERILTEPLVL